MTTYTEDTYASKNKKDKDLHYVIQWSFSRLLLPLLDGRNRITFLV